MLLVDFTKAFDIVHHGILASKLAQLNIPPSILHWIMSFLTDRTHKVKFADYLSSFRPINKGIVQGSGISLSLYIVMESDLKALSAINIFTSCARPQGGSQGGFAATRGFF